MKIKTLKYNQRLVFKGKDKEIGKAKHELKVLNLIKTIPHRWQALCDCTKHKFWTH